MKISSTILGTTVLVVLLTTATAQSLAGSNTVFSDDIVDGQIKHIDIKENTIGSSRMLDNSVHSVKISDGSIVAGDMADNAVTGTKIANEAVSGSKIASSSVNGAKVLDNSLAGADINESTLVPTCPPAGILTMANVGDVCYGSEQGPSTWNTALADCKDEGLRLPTLGEARLLPGNAVWTDVYYDDDNSTVSSFGVVARLDDMTVKVPHSDLRPYRCVTTIGARP